MSTIRPANRPPPIKLSDISEDALGLATQFRTIAEDIDVHVKKAAIYETNDDVDADDIFGDVIEREQLNLLYRQWEDFRSKIPKAFKLPMLEDTEAVIQIQNLLNMGVTISDSNEDKISELAEQVLVYVTSESSVTAVVLPDRLNVAGFAFSLKDLVEIPVDVSPRTAPILPGTVLKNVAGALDSLAIMMPNSAVAKNRTPAGGGWV